MEAVLQRRKRSTYDTWPVPPALLPRSGPNPRGRIPPWLDVWLRLHPPSPRDFLALAVLVVLVAACARLL